MIGIKGVYVTAGWKQLPKSNSTPCYAFVLSVVKFKNVLLCKVSVFTQCNYHVSGKQLPTHCCVAMFHSLHNVKCLTHYTQCTAFNSENRQLNQSTYHYTKKGNTLQFKPY